MYSRSRSKSGSGAGGRASRDSTFDIRHSTMSCQQHVWIYSGSHLQHQAVIRRSLAMPLDPRFEPRFPGIQPPENTPDDDIEECMKEYKIEKHVQKILDGAAAKLSELENTVPFVVESDAIGTEEPRPKKHR